MRLDGAFMDATTKAEAPRRSWLLALAALLCGCVATPLPTPPSAAPDRMQLIASQNDQVALLGAAGAIAPGGVTLRVTVSTDEVEGPVAMDGAFAVVLAAGRDDRFDLFVVDAGSVAFVAAVTGGPGTSVVVVATPEPGQDPAGAGGAGDPAGGNDAAGDPNAAGDPANDPANCNAANDPACAVELCNGVDDDADGVIDEGRANGG